MTASPSRPGRLLQRSEEIAELLGRVRRIAVLGIKTEAAAGQPAYDVAAYEQRAGYTIIPVPVYYPNATEILGEPVVRRVVDAPPPIDVVQIFRRPEDIPPHVDDILAARPAAVWMQLGIRHDAAAAQFVAAGIDVVKDHCVKIELMRLGR
ncbi:MAG: CoA-binding protein [Gemmatimonadaceae bacterium]|nr:CoA-binding protein [Gemmatimonadaceae bacterium]